MSRNGLFIDYCAKDFLDGVQQLSPMEELAYRRICDMIYATDNNLIDDDESLAWSTKTGAAWPQIKTRLLGLGKIASDGQRLLNDRCTSVLAKSAKRIAQKSTAGTASAEARKAKRLKERQTGSTAVETDVATDGQRQGQRIQEPKNPFSFDYDGEQVSEHIRVARRLLEIFQTDFDDRNWFGTQERCRQWLAAGWDPEGLIYAAARKYAADHDGRAPPGLRYFEKVIRSFADDLNRPLPEVKNVNGPSTSKQSKPSLSDRFAKFDQLGSDPAVPMEPGPATARGIVIDQAV